MAHTGPNVLFSRISLCHSGDAGSERHRSADSVLADACCSAGSCCLQMWAADILSAVRSAFHFDDSSSSSACRVHMERGIFLPGVLLPLLPDPAGRAGLWHLLLLQEQRSFRSVSGKPGPEGLHQAGAHLWVNISRSNRTPQKKACAEYTTRTRAQDACWHRSDQESCQVVLLFCLLSGSTSWNVVDSFISPRSVHAVRPSQHDVILMTHSTMMSRCDRRH